jgi:hypothetical protein
MFSAKIIRRVFNILAIDFSVATIIKKNFEKVVMEAFILEIMIYIKKIY